MLVNPSLLRAFAEQVNTAASAIAATNIGTTAETAGDGLPGSETQWAARQVGVHLRLIAEDIANDIAAMGEAVRGMGDSYEVTDEALAGNFTKLF
ncbi:type VII secretion target [Mycobacterium sp. 236(2023)]|uniref:type VII secretion target n=1 Tax=Mycobacterium sp. 236(2023) TaxID=3038163 RepID=UPI0024155E67|nr:type VII secretion target [Mycobacterium sp. 236(2023)]MDG4665529.1 type VII secretion target [Mycobacterium sp. 236(2023)]